MHAFVPLAIVIRMIVPKRGGIMIAKIICEKYAVDCRTYSVTINIVLCVQCDISYFK